MQNNLEAIHFLIDTLMIKITLLENAVANQGTSIEVKVGQSLMKAAVGANIEGVAADCGGTLTCATCHVMVREPWLSLSLIHI